MDNFCYKFVKMFICKFLNVFKVRLIDYFVFIFKCEIFGNECGKGFWKLNILILKELLYCNLINNFFDKLFDDIM